jgi:endonuclease/exonuclease/phosphatase (EEP) superfamily protein YafD
MTPRDPKGDAPTIEPTTDERAEVAALAAKVATLPHGAAKPHGRFWWLCYGLFWMGTLTLVCFALLKIFYHDGTRYLTWINAFTRYVYLPAYVSLAWALWMRRWALAGVACSAVACHVVWMWPDFVRDQRFDPPTPAAAASKDAPTLRIFFANVWASNTNLEPTWREIEESQPDVVVLAECSRSTNRLFRQEPSMAAYVAANGSLKTQRGEVVIFSKLPVQAEQQHWSTGRVVQVVDLSVGGQTLRLIGLHAPRPMRPPAYDYFGYWNAIVPLLTSQKGPVVIVGDFNATEHSLVYEQLKESGLRSAHDDRGRGYATTWPNGTLPIPPIRIDQAFLSPDVECLGIREGQGDGSDHKPLILDVRLRIPLLGGSLGKFGELDLRQSVSQHGRCEGGEAELHPRNAGVAREPGLNAKRS